ncbi:Nucleoside triphosphatase NudI [compost metagenome]
MDKYVKEIRAKIGHIPMFMPVVGLIVYKNGKILLQRRADNKMWAMHGGGINPNEAIYDALNREIFEEVGIIPKDPKLLGIYTGERLFHTYPNGDQVYIVNHTFFCEEYEGEIKFNDGEVIDYCWFNINELPDNIQEVDKPIIEDIELYIKTRQPIIR